MQIVSFNHPEQKSGSDIRQFLNDELRQTFSCELVMREMTPFLIKQSLSEELTRALSIFFLETERNAGELEEIFSLLQLRPEEGECAMVKGMVQTIWTVCSCTIRGPVRDAAILLMVQKIINFQVVSYRALTTYLRRMKQPKAALLLESIISEKKRADYNFHILSVSLNQQATFSESNMSAF